MVFFAIYSNLTAKLAFFFDTCKFPALYFEKAG